MRKIPTSMATQHPDNASIPYWQSRPFVSTFAELEESYLSFSDLGIDEYNWDWEGKFVDEAVVDRLMHKYYSYFKKHPIGEDKFLTFRIPNPWIEKQFRLARAFMVMITSSQYATSLGFRHPPLFETILPLTETADQIFDIQEAFRHLIDIDHKLLRMNESIKNIEIIPLFEQVSKIIHSGDLLLTYIKMLKDKWGYIPSYIRPYCARSDPALNSGLVPTVLAVKVALSSYRKIEEKTGVKLYPMLGTGTLPFRGSLSPEYIDQTIEEYEGIATFTLQSAFRYDFPTDVVKKAIRRLKNQLPLKKAVRLSSLQKETVSKVIPQFENPYRISIEKLAPLINTISKQFPKRRERMQHIGLFGYSRGIGKVKLPRAIPFTGSLYSLGIPPELIGTGRGLRAAKEKGLWTHLDHVYINLKKDIIRAGYFLNRDNIKRLKRDISNWPEIEKDITFLEKELKIQLGPRDDMHKKHLKITEKIYKKLKEGKDIEKLIIEGGILRKSLG